MQFANRQIRELEEEELHKITSIIAGLKKQLKRGNEMEQHVSKALKLKNDTSMLISLQKFQKDMASHIPEVVAPCDFSYIKGNPGFTSDFNFSPSFLISLIVL
jgi:hypothetical protein